MKILKLISALYGENMDKLFENIAISIYEKDKKLESEKDNVLRKTITIVKEDFTMKGKKKKKSVAKVKINYNK